MSIVTEQVRYTIIQNLKVFKIEPQQTRWQPPTTIGKGQNDHRTRTQLAWSQRNRTNNNYKQLLAVQETEDQVLGAAAVLKLW
jgi:hypothetical protein